MAFSQVGYLDARKSVIYNAGRDCNQTTNYTILVISPCVSPQRNHRVSIADTPIYSHESSLARQIPVTYTPSNAVFVVGAVVDLIEKITELLMDSRQSSIAGGHRELALELESLQMTLTLTRRAIQMYENKPMGQSLVNTITPEVLGCLFALRELFDRIDGTWLDLSITSIGGLWRRIWTVCWDRDTFPLLRRKLSYSRQSLQGLLMALHWYVLFVIHCPAPPLNNILFYNKHKVSHG